jgi:hypothetical protein
MRSKGVEDRVPVPAQKNAEVAAGLTIPEEAQMTNLSDDKILRAVSDLEPRWQELLGDTGATAAKSLLQVAARDEALARRAANRLLDLFDQEEARAVLREQIEFESLTKGAHRFFDPLPGDTGPVATPGVLYGCPVPGCPVTWELQVAGQAVPTCSRHPDQRLVPC